MRNTLVKVELVDARPAYINPEHVVSVEQRDGFARMIMVRGEVFNVPGTAEKLVELLIGK